MHWSLLCTALLTLSGADVITSVNPGNWSSLAAWSTATTPARDQDVTIATKIVFDVFSAKIGKLTIKSGGELVIPPNVMTYLYVDEIWVEAGGTLTIGSENQPVTGLATIVFNDEPIDTAKDPEQLGRGLICRGKLRAYGRPRQGHTLLASPVRAGDKILRLANPGRGWQKGDYVYVPDTRQQIINQTRTDQGEFFVIEQISNDEMLITLQSAARFTHDGAKTAEGQIVYLPHVANVTRSINFFSANPKGTRAHTYFNEHADVTIAYVGFYDLGRTTNAPLNSTTFNANGNVVKVGTNQIGRYAMHAHHLHGPEGGRPDGYQFAFIGNAIWSRNPVSRWGITVHHSHFGLIKDNVVVSCAGSGIVTEDGNEIHNLFERNFVANVRGTGTRADARPNEIGFEGSGFWLRGPGNRMIDNVIADCTGDAGFTYYPRFAPIYKVPTDPGGLESVPYDPVKHSIPEFRGNVVYSSRYGFQPWWVGVMDRTPYPETPESLIKDLVIWNCPSGVSSYEVGNFTYDGLVVIGDYQQRYEFNGGWGASDYVQYRTKILNSRIENMSNGISCPVIADALRASGTNPGIFVVKDTTIRCKTAITSALPWHNANGANLPPVLIHLDNVALLDLPKTNESRLFEAGKVSGEFTNYRQWCAIFGNNMKRPGLPSAFQVFGPTQLPTAKMTASGAGGRIVGAPEAGLTNQQNWDTNATTTGGQLASGQSVTGVNGLLLAREEGKLEIQPQPNYRMQPGASLEIRNNTYDPKFGKLRYRLQGAPDGMKIDAVTGVLTWSTVSETPTGEYPVTVIVEDTENTLRNDSTAFTIVLRHPSG